MIIQEYTKIVSKKTFGLFVISYIFRLFFRINCTTKLIVHFSNRIAGSNDIVLTGEGNSFLLSMLSNVGIYIGTSNNGVIIDRSVYIASGTKIISANHDLNDLTTSGVHAEPVVIKENCWLGANSVILPSVILGPNTVVAAGAVVTHSFPEGNLILAGVPAKVLRLL